MRISNAVWTLLLAAGSVASVLPLVQGCSEAVQTTDPGATSAEGALSSDAGPTPPAADEAAPILCNEPDPADRDVSCELNNPDPSCNSSDASTGAECSIDCRIECGFNGSGLKHCQCENGTYARCPCNRPASYGGALSARFCSVGSGRVAELDDNPCEVEWEQCIGTDPVPGTPQGCACMRNDQGDLQWFCGSTNNWFALESEAGNGACEGENPDPRCDGINPDPSCNSSDARTGSECTMGCLVGCGFQRLGLKSCTCGGGVYSQCPCLPPDGYLGAPTAPACDTMGSPDGTADALDDEPCDDEWAQCIGNDETTSTTPRGCACLLNRISQQLQWYCGSTNRWFAPE